MRGKDFVYYHKLFFQIMNIACVMKLFIGSALERLSEMLAVSRVVLAVLLVLFGFCAILWGYYWGGVKADNPLPPKNKQIISLCFVIACVALDVFIALATRSYGWFVSALLIAVLSIPYFHALKHPEMLADMS